MHFLTLTCKLWASQKFWHFLVWDIVPKGGWKQPCACSLASRLMFRVNYETNYWISSVNWHPSGFSGENDGLQPSTMSLWILITCWKESNQTSKALRRLLKRSLIQRCTVNGPLGHPVLEQEHWHSPEPHQALKKPRSAQKLGPRIIPVFHIVM